MVHVNPQDNVILEGETVTRGESGSVEAAEQELGMIMAKDTLHPSLLQHGNQESVQDILIESQNGSLPKYTDKRMPSKSVHKEFSPVEMEHPYTKEKIEGRECKHCLTVIKGKNPTNLRQHLKRLHPAVVLNTLSLPFIGQYN